MDQLKRKLNCLVIEASVKQASLLAGFIVKHVELELIRICETVHEAAPISRIVDIDLIFLQVDTLSKRQLEQFAQENRDTLLILLTHDPHFEVQGLEANVFHCLVQPLGLFRLKLVINRVCDHFLSQQEPTLTTRYQTGIQILVRSGGREHRLSTADVVYIQSDGEYLKYYTEKGMFMALGSLRRKGRELGGDFIQVHRSYVVNRNYVQARNNQKLELEGNRVIPIGKTYRNAFQFVSSHVLS